MKKKFNFKLILISSLILCVLAVSFVVPSFAEDTVSVSYIPDEYFEAICDGVSVGTPFDVTYDSIHSIFFNATTVQNYYYQVYFNGSELSYDRSHPTVISPSSDIVFTRLNAMPGSRTYYFIIESPPPTPVPTPVPTPAPDVWDSTSEFTGGFFGGATSIFNALFSSPVFALLVIGLPLAGIIIGFVLKVTFLKKKR